MINNNFTAFLLPLRSDGSNQRTLANLRIIYTLIPIVGESGASCNTFS